MRLGFAILVAAVGCSNRKDVQCNNDGNCDLAAGGVCVTAASGNRWCAYPDQGCPSGYRFSDFDVGDGVSDACVDGSDGGVDGGTCSDQLIAFVRDDGLYVVHPDGSGVQSLATGNQEANPAWSPDGSRVAFVRGDAATNLDIWAVNRDGTGLTNLTQGVTQHDSDPVWSPDGLHIAFGSQRNDGVQYDLWVMEADGRNPVMIDVKARVASWSPDGTRIAYASYKVNSRYQIYVANADGSNSVNISNSTYTDSDPEWSPDGTMLTFSGVRPTFPATYVMNADGSNQQALAPSLQGSGNPTWSPDSKRIAFEGGVDNTQQDVYAVNADRTNLMNITAGTMTSDEYSPTWSPDGKQLAISTTRDSSNGKREIYRINDDGTGPLRLTTSSLYDDKTPAWSPCR